MMIPWLIVAAEVVTAFAVMHFVKGKKQERKILIGLFVLIFLASCVALFLMASEGGDTSWLKAICFGLNMTCLLSIDDAKKRKK